MHNMLETEKSLNFVLPFSRTEKLSSCVTGPGKSWKTVNLGEVHRFAPGLVQYVVEV